jgi:N-acetylglutamate synthase and related acetyltransferases
MIGIRPYTPNDLDTVIEIFRRAILETASKDYNEAQIQAWAQVDRNRWQIHRQSRPTWLAFFNDQAAGFTDLEPDGHLDMLFVHPLYQGRGVATALIRTVEAAAREQHLQRIFTEASITAKPFFEKQGFTLVTDQWVEVRGQRLQNFKMEKYIVA